MTPKEFHYAITETNKREEEQVKVKYVVARWLAKHIWNSRKRFFPKFISDAKDIEPFAWENDVAQNTADMKVAMLNIFYTFKHMKPKKKKKK